LNFSDIAQIKDGHLQLVFSSATRSKMELDAKRLHISAFEVFIAQVK